MTNYNHLEVGVRLLSLSLLIYIFGIIFLSLNTDYTQAQCRSEIPGFLCSKAISADGYKHIAVNLSAGNEGSPNSDELSYMQTALDEWNQHKNISGVVFDVAPPGATGDLQFKFTTDDEDAGGCARFDGVRNRIKWGQNLRNTTRITGVQFKTVFKHELGHSLGLAHTTGSPPTIMHQGSFCDSPLDNREVKASDAQKVADCLNNCPGPIIVVPTPTPSGSGGPPCEDYWIQNPIYNNEGFIIGFEWVYVGNCNY